MLVGVLASLALAVLAFVRISPTGISYRSSERWVNEATLVVTQAGFNEGRSGGGAAVDTTLQRFAALVNVYAALVESDEVVDLLVKRGLVEREDVAKGEIPVVATPVVSDNGASTPLMTITASANSAAKATALTTGATRAFIDALERRQRAAGIPTSQRTLVQPVRRFGEPTLVEPRSKSLPIIVFLAGLSATFAAAIIRDGRLRRQAEDPRKPSSPSPFRSPRRASSLVRCLRSGLVRRFEAAATAHQANPDHPSRGHDRRVDGPRLRGDHGSTRGGRRLDVRQSVGAPVDREHATRKPELSTVRAELSVRRDPGLQLLTGVLVALSTASWAVVRERHRPR